MKSKALQRPRIILLTEREHVKRVVSEILRLRPPAVGIDTETTGANIFEDRIALISFYAPCCITVRDIGVVHEAAAYIVLGPVLEADFTLQELEPLLTSDIPKVGSNISGFDYFMFRNHGIEMKEPIYDTLVMSWLYDENRTKHGLKELMYDFFGFSMRSFEDASRGAVKATDYRTWDLNRLKAYAGLDGWASYKVWLYLQQKLKKKQLVVDRKRTLWDVYLEMIYPIQAIIREMNSLGVRIDVEYLEGVGKRLREKQESLKEQIQKEAAEAYRKAGYEQVPIVNPRSTRQLHELFFKVLKAKAVRWGKPHSVTGEQSESLDREALSIYASQEGRIGKIAQLIQDFREFDKLFGTYIGAPGKKTGILNKLRDGRIHTTFYMATVTGRLRSRDPNLMNIPARTEIGKEIRRAFIASEGYKMIVADYAQIEMRLLAHFAEMSAPPKQRLMSKAINEGLDLHCWTASIMQGVPYEELLVVKKKDDAQESLTKDEKELLSLRSAAKAIGFGLIYGMGAHSLAQRLGVSVGRAEELIQLYFSAYPSVERWIKRVVHFCETHQEVWTLLYRPRRIREIRSSDKGVQSRARRQAVNSVIQGSAADVMLVSMRKIAHDEELRRMGLRILLQIHDELVMEVPEEAAEEALPRVISLMEWKRGREPLIVDLDVSAHIGENWADTK